MRPKKSLGQHFLKDPNISRKIVSALGADTGDTVVEIGPGTGALTQWLVESYQNLVVVETDERACEILNTTYPNLEVIHEDILTFDWSRFQDQAPIYVIGNLPYYITSPILFSLLEFRHLIAEAILMIQKEVAYRIVSEPSTKEYGILSVQFQLFASVERCFDVSRHVFYPPPKVESSVIRLTFDKAEPKCDTDLLRKVIRTAFNQRRKKLKNALKPILRKGAEPATDINLNRRAEELQPDEFVDLTNLLSNSGNLSI